MTQRTPHILVVDDDREIRRLVSRFLTENGFRTTEAKDVREAETALGAGKFELVVLDLMMPGEDGLSFARRLRAQDRIPIVMLTARAEETDRVVGLEIGADDYIVKPFSPRELGGRVRARLRRTGDGELAQAKPKHDRLGFDGWVVDLVRRELRAPDASLVSLTAAEFDLLVALAERARRVVSRDELSEILHGRTPHPLDRSIDVAVSRLRRKIEHSPDEPRYVRTVRNGGYVFAVEVENGAVHPVEPSA
ncbi:MAG: response regulator [Alphaproteobacteria bacterium]|nr:response regulator [Alphaproteobacteria bacterium]